MHIIQDQKLDFKDVLIRPKRSSLNSRAKVNLVRKFKFLHSKLSWEGVPIIAANMDHTGTFPMAKQLHQHKMLTAINKFETIADWKMFARESDFRSSCFVSVGILPKDIQYLSMVMNEVNADFICIDVANGYTQSFIDALRKIREAYPEKIIMAGNVVTPEMVEEILLSGADIVKIGVGPGSVCTTRKKTGVGYPQLSATIECADAARGLGGHICVDGGCTSPGDVAKAFGGGADFVMLGGMFAGHKECSGQHIVVEGREYMRFYGMSSAESMQKHYGKINNYRASEGKSVNVPFRGSVEETVLDILGGLRSACTYIGANNLKEFPKRATFIKVAEQLNEVFSSFEAA